MAFEPLAVQNVLICNYFLSCDTLYNLIWLKSVQVLFMLILCYAVGFFSRVFSLGRRINTRVLYNCYVKSWTCLSVIDLRV